MPEKPKLVGINHIALEVGNIDEALAFYGRIFDFKLRGIIPGYHTLRLAPDQVNVNARIGCPAIHIRACIRPIHPRILSECADKLPPLAADVLR